MTPLVQAVLVAIIVAASATYAGLKLMPAALRRALAARAAALATRAGLSETRARRVEAKLATGGACGSCDSCKACATPVAEGAGPAAAPIPVPSTLRRTIPIAAPDARRRPAQSASSPPIIDC